MRCVLIYPQNKSSSNSLGSRWFKAQASISAWGQAETKEGGNVRIWPWAYGPVSRLLTKAQGRHYDYKSNSRWTGMGGTNYLKYYFPFSYCSFQLFLLPPQLSLSCTWILYLLVPSRTYFH